MNIDPENAKWLRLAFETYGAGGAAAMAQALALPMLGAQRIGVPGSTSTTTHSSDNFDPTQFVGDTQRSSAACPKAPPLGMPGWRPYVGESDWFHCGFEGYLEDREPSPDWPIGECFYDKRGRLVDEDHPYRGCRGTPNQYTADDLRHIWPDDGGVARNAWDAYGESQRYFDDEARRVREKFKHPYWRLRYRRTRNPLE